MYFSRRKFIRKASLLGTFTATGSYELLKNDFLNAEDLPADKYLSLEKPQNNSYYLPLERVDLIIKEIDKGRIRVYDGHGHPYFQDDVRGRLNFRAAGHLGYHTIQLFDNKDQLIEQSYFPVNAKTEIRDEQNEFRDLLSMLCWSIFRTEAGMGKTLRFNQKYYKVYSGWFQDTMYAVSRAMKYFTDDIEGSVDLYGDGQRADGMIFDNYKHPFTREQSYWEYRFNYGNFVYRPEDPYSSALFVKVPVENIGQYSFIEGLYFTWKANGNDLWLKKHINRAVRAVEFATISEYYWSKKYRLLRRPFTIDIWDFQPDEDAAIAGGDIMGVDLEKTRFGIHFGDNVAFASACNQLGEMLEHLGRTADADKMRKLSGEILDRINDLAWNGDFYTHHIPEDPDIHRNLGVDQSKQVSLSNTLSLNRGIDHSKCVSIVKQYQYIRKEMPASSPGEWYTIYPPFGEKEFGRPQWHYMNGGVTTIAAGELARGAFEHGFEAYGVDILRRLGKIAKLKDNSLKGCYRGAMPELPQRSFTPVDLKKIANTSKTADKKGNVPGWIGSGKDDFRNLPSGRATAHDIPFDLINPSNNAEKACLVLSGDNSFTPSGSVPIGAKAESIYFLHTMTSDPVAGIIKIIYDDQSQFHHYVTRNGSGNNDSGDIAHWWYPTLREVRGIPPSSVVWWRGPSTEVKDVGLVCFGLNNPFPGKMIKQIVLENEDQKVKWAIFGITLCDKPVFFMPDIESTIPDHWGASHVVYGLLEGLAGIQDSGIAFNKAILAPRWTAAAVNDVTSTVKYESSGGYISYVYKFIPGENKLIVEFTGTAENTKVKIPVPSGKNLAGVYCDREICKYNVEEVEKSTYAIFDVPGIGWHIAEVRFN